MKIYHSLTIVTILVDNTSATIMDEFNVTLGKPTTQIFGNLTIDTLAPTLVSFSANQTTLLIGESANITLIFSENVPNLALIKDANIKFSENQAAITNFAPLSSKQYKRMVFYYYSKCFC